MDTFIAVVIIFGVLVSIHEFGHLILAKRAGILCREFAIGFGPKLFSIKKKETVYTLRLLPIGGFVRMAGEDPEIVEIKPGQRVGLTFNNFGQVTKIYINHLEKHPEAKAVIVDHADLEGDLIIRGYEDEVSGSETYELDRKAEYVMDEQGYQIAPLDRQFGSKSVFDRFLAILAGPFMNFILALVVLIVYFMLQGIPSDQAKIGQVQGDTPAAKAGLEHGDVVKQINDEPVDGWNEMATTISKHPGDRLNVTIARNGQTQDVQLTPDERPKQPDSGYIGVTAFYEKSFVGSIQHGVFQTFNFIKLELDALKQLVTGAIGLDSLAGPVGIYNMTGQAVDQGLLFVLNWAGLLSINLAIINLLPLPALDGGRLLFLIFEGIRGKPVDPQKETLAHFVGFALLMLLMIVVTWNDIQRIFMMD
ncbi:RIP metalloprotease RseP [Tuberibacillus sp. Marseille-P3662]|uniref:RIP metalloprotease RseP n=1 Tax=Tuberibacillus sp. Marseille-P3662 TaxID=1965358 RepID=UPI000A1C7E9C|nr:RIP metalloprotease RseP [Tuberibacillus sp. Marseille-P3662]